MMGKADVGCYKISRTIEIVVFSINQNYWSSGIGTHNKIST